MTKLSFFLFALLTGICLNAQDITGEWYGDLKVPGTQLPLVFHISETAKGLDATMDSPAQGAFGIQAGLTSFKDSILEVNIGNGAITYEATLIDKGIFQGTFIQSGISYPLDLSRERGKKEEMSRPQEPKEPIPYHTQEVSFLNAKSGITLAGTLSLPFKEMPIPAVILISGSGPQNRDQEIMGHKPFLVISDYLTRNGIAVLRFDDRGVAESEGDFSIATTNDFATDVEAALDFLTSRKEIDGQKIGLIGHSEGGAVAPIVVNKSKNVDFMVLLASPGLRGDKLMLLQREALQRQMGLMDDQIQADLDLFGGVYKLILNSQNTGSELKTEIYNYFSNEPENPLDEQTMNQVSELYSSPWWVNFLKYDPAVALEKVDIPVLALNGQKDLQVTPQENLEAIQKALEKGRNKNVEVKQLENLNHLFQESDSGLPSEYSQIEQTFSPEALQHILKWILEQVN